MAFIKKRNGPYLLHAKWFDLNPMCNRVRDVRPTRSETIGQVSMLFYCLLLSVFSEISSAVDSLIPQMSIKCLLCAKFDARCLDTGLSKNKCVLCSLQHAYSIVLMGEMDIIE